MAAGGRTVLVVDDTEDARLLATLQLRQGGYETATACDGADALDYLHTHTAPDVIVLDLRMPRMDGWQFLAVQEREPALATIPVVIYSCEGHLRSERGFTASVVCCLVKNGNQRDLLSAIESAVRWETKQ